MLFFEPITWLWFGLAAFAAGFIKLGFGLGAGALVTPVLSMLIPSPALAVVLMSVLLSSTNFEGVRAYWRQWDLSVIGPTIPAAILGTYIGAQLVATVPASTLRHLIGIVGISIGLWGLARLLTYRGMGSPPGIPMNRWARSLLAVSVGFLAGVVGVLANGSGVTLAPYLLLVGVDKQGFVANTMLFLAMTDVVKLSIFIQTGLLTITEFATGAMVFPLLLLGAYLGRRVNARLTNRNFNYVLNTALLGIGLLLLVR